MIGLVVRGRQAALVGGSLATALVVALALHGGAPLAWPLVLHFLIGPAVLEPRAARTLLLLQLLVLPAAVFLLGALAVFAHSLFHSETAAGLLAAAFFALEPALAVAWIGPNPRRFEG